jgi:hypothetical protein
LAQSTATITEVSLAEDGRMGGKITCPRGLLPAPGQYLLAQAAGSMEALPAVLFPMSLRQVDLQIAPPLPSGWQVGMNLSIRGPLGHGFRPPDQARRWLLAAPYGGAERLLPLLPKALEQSVDVALFAAHLPYSLPAAVEVVAAGQLSEALRWADYLALDFPLVRLKDVRSLLGIDEHRRALCPAQALVETPLSCGGVAGCGVCAVRTRAGWKLACSDGPVFDLDDLEVE